MRRVPTSATKNQEIPFSDVQSFLQGSTPKRIGSESDLPPVTNGFHQLEPLESYIFTQPNTSITDPILLPAGYIGYIQNSFLDSTGVIYIQSSPSFFINTLNLEGAITSVANSFTEPGTKIRIASNSHGVLDGQFVNIKNMTDTSYNGDRKQISNVTGDSFDVIGSFGATDTGDFDTGYQALQFRHFISATPFSTNQFLNITSSGDENSSLTFLSCAFFGYGGMGTVKKAIGIFSDGCLFTSLGSTFTIDNGDAVNFSNTRFRDFEPTGTNPIITLTGSSTKSVGIINSRFDLANSAQTVVRVDPSIITAQFVRIENSSDNDIATNYFDISAGGLDETDPQVIATDNGVRKNSMTVCEARSGATLIVDSSGGPAPILNTASPTPGDWIEDPSTERFSVNTTTGQVTYTGLKPIIVQMSYFLDAAAASGAAQTIDFDIRINDVGQTKTIRSGDFTTTSSSIVYNGGNFLLNPADTIQLFLNNQTNTTDTNVTNATLLINLD